MAKHAAQRQHQGASRMTAGDDGRHTIQRTHIAPHILITHHTELHTSYAHYINLTAFSHQHAHPQMQTGPTVSATNPSLVIFSPRDLPLLARGEKSCNLLVSTCWILENLGI